MGTSIGGILVGILIIYTAYSFWADYFRDKKKKG